MDRWNDFVAAMHERPTDTLLMGVAADYLEDHGDPRHEPLRWLAENGKVGFVDGGYFPHRRNMRWQAWHTPGGYVLYPWYHAALAVMDEDSYSDPVAFRMALLDTWRREWLRN